MGWDGMKGLSPRGSSNNEEEIERDRERERHRKEERKSNITDKDHTL